MPDANVRLPDKVSAKVPANVPVNPVKFNDCAGLATVTVTVPEPDAASKNTSSVLVGTAAPPAPPDVVAHFVPAIASHDAVPPTQ